MTAHGEIFQGAGLAEVRRRIAWLDRLQTIRRAALPLAGIGAILGLMITPIIFPLVAVVIGVVLWIVSRRARAARPGLLADIDNLDHRNFVQDAEAARLRSAVDRATLGQSSGWSSIM